MEVPKTRLNRLGIEFPFMVGPMVGLSHAAFRDLIRSYLPMGINALLFTEMLSTRRLPNENVEEVHALRCSPDETYFIPQLLGNEERFIAPSIKKLLAKNPWGFDINMGCPASHLLKHNWGVMLMGDKQYAAEVVRITKSQSSLPLSVKMRSGGEETGTDYLADFTDHLEKAGADWITLHCRPKAQGHAGEANWAAVAEVAKRRSIPVVANGDIQTADDALMVVKEFGVDGAMIGRAATGRPWILWQIAQKMGCETSPADHPGERAPVTPAEESREYFRACLKFLDLLPLYSDDEAYCLKKFQFFVVQGSRWFLFGHHFWSVTMKAKTLTQARELVSDYAAKNDFPITQRVRFY